MREKGKSAYETQMTKLIEPCWMQLELTNRNGVFRRSVMNPLFNSLFVNECRNDYYYMWRLQNDGCWWMMVWIVGYSFSTLPQSFGVTLSLPTFTTKNSEEEEQELLSLYTYLINLIWALFVKKDEWRVSRQEDNEQWATEYKTRGVNNENEGERMKMVYNGSRVSTFDYIHFL